MDLNKTVYLKYDKKNNIIKLKCVFNSTKYTWNMNKSRIKQTKNDKFKQNVNLQSNQMLYFGFNTYGFNTQTVLNSIHCDFLSLWEPAVTL